MDMCRFWGYDDPGYQKVGMELKILGISKSSLYSAPKSMALTYFILLAHEEGITGLLSLGN
jgi:hypothetical protein